MKRSAWFFGMVGLLTAVFLPSCSQLDHPASLTVSVETETDFLLRFEENRYTAAKPGLARVDTAVIRGIRHWGIFEHAPNRVEFPDVYIGPDARLEFATGILEGAWKNSGDGVRFQISVQPSGRPLQVCFSRYIDPKRDEGHRAWLPGEAALSGIENTTATFLFETFPGENPGDSNSDSDWAFWANPRLVSRGRESVRPVSSRPNILLITVDTLRADYLGCYGHPYIQTPAIDRLAAAGILFEQARSACFHTNPSFVSLLTSLSPFAHGLIGNEQRLRISLPCLPQILKELGYTTAAALSAYHLENVMAGLGFWFDRYEKPLPMKIRPGSLTTSAAIRGLEQVMDRPFFYWVHYYDPHQPYQALGEYHGMYYRGDPAGSAHHSMDKARFHSSWNAESPDSWVRGIRDLEYFKKEYAAEISYTDSQIARLLEALRRLHLDRDTIVLFTADHGESLGEHGVYFDHWTPYDTDLHVPLIVAYPPALPSGKRITTPVSTLDVAPTLLDLIGEGSNILAQKLFEGRSLRSLWQSPGEWEPRVLSSDGVFYTNLAGWDGRYKVIWELQRFMYHEDYQLLPGRVWIFDLQSDPGETRPAGCFYWRSGASEADAWKDAVSSPPPVIDYPRIARVKENALKGKSPTADELRGWFQENNGRDFLREDLLRDDQFLSRLAGWLETLRRRVNPLPLRERIKDFPDLAGLFEGGTEFTQPVDPQMKEFLHSLGYVSNQ
ncbi:MAG: sulfatase [bacterium]